MNGFMKAVLALVFFSLVIAAPSIRASWVWDGLPVCDLEGIEELPKIVSDGAGGAIVIWQDYRSGTNGDMYRDIYAQRVRAMGSADWTPNGVPICTAAESQSNAEIISDGAGGAIVTWTDHRSGTDSDIYAQRVDAEGTVRWTVNGEAICTAAGDQSVPGITSDGAGGAIITWTDFRSGNSDIYAQRVNAVGEHLWAENGVALCTEASAQSGSLIVSDDAGGAIVTWTDLRNGNNDIYAQRVNASGVVRWTHNGVVLCAETANQTNLGMISDGASGAIVTWMDYRDGGWDIYAQRVSDKGDIVWKSDGVALCTATGSQGTPEITSDGKNGAIVTWVDYRGGSWCDIYAQRVDALGDSRWTFDGVALCTARDNQDQPAITSDGNGGAIVTWHDDRPSNYAQRVDASGAVRWTVDGVALCSASRERNTPAITSDGAGGAIVAWQDVGGLDSHWDIYAQFIDRLGRLGNFAPNILSVQDVPGDQGGWVRINLAKSSLGEETAIFNVWQRIDDPAMLAMIAQRNSDGAAGMRLSEVPLKHPVDASSVSSWPIRECKGRYFVQPRELLGTVGFQLPPGTWELLGSFAACGEGQYIYRASTLSDSTGSGIPYSVYVVSEHFMNSMGWYASDPDSGYSVDNLPPEPPEGLVAEQSFVPAGLALGWDVNAANDLSHYAVYRGTSESFEPAVENRIAAPLAPEFFDGKWRWNGGFYYKISALDVHGNESGFALLRPEDVTGAETPKAPEATYLKQNYPNPFNPMTKIEYGLAAPEWVSLRIYDAAGRLVRELVNETRPAARYEDVWDGRDGAGRQIASGMYFYRLDAGAFTQTKKMILLR
jgi:hypothetical protein